MKNGTLHWILKETKVGQDASKLANSRFNLANSLLALGEKLPVPAFSLRAHARTRQIEWTPRSFRS